MQSDVAGRSADEFSNMGVRENMSQMGNAFDDETCPPYSPIEIGAV